ncbi:MAG: hypothetical protein AB1480_02745 [Nitrospirota bacterium]
MSYEANYNSALSYLKLGQIDLAVESLHRAYSQVPDKAKRDDNAVYLKILSLLARFNLEEKDPQKVWNYVDEGLRIKENHIDLLFLKSLLLLDERRFDEMLVTLITYLLSFDTEEIKKYNYELVNEATLKEIFDNLIPLSYRNSIYGVVIKDKVKIILEKTGNKNIERVLNIMASADRGQSK